ncbi:protein DMP8-like [Prosopis cineraria]|uniref:protein DMP8-like n=1 Tax=Prosopis cineraria TaxID=364024 RepID=UPI00240EBB1D|nr:protein DMP8-like [Prosopis cineraria]
MPVSQTLIHHHLQIDHVCFLYGNNTVTREHVFQDCVIARAVCFVFVACLYFGCCFAYYKKTQRKAQPGSRTRSCGHQNLHHHPPRNDVLADRKGSKRQAMAKGMQKTISKTSMLVNFLPTGTLLTFEMLLPSVSRNGDCSAPVTTLMILVLLGLCCLSCFFFHFTDSFRGSDGKVYYGLVTPRGLAVFRHGLGEEVPKDERFKLGFTDFVHAIMSVMVFLAIAMSDHRVSDCVFPGHVKDMEQVMESFPLMVGIVCSTLFLVFPTTRYGVGCMTS